MTALHMFFMEWFILILIKILLLFLWKFSVAIQVQMGEVRNSTVYILVQPDFKKGKKREKGGGGLEWGSVWHLRIICIVGPGAKI